MTDQQIAIDGPAASGKSTVAKRVAAAVNAHYINTGAMYRTLTWVVLQHGLDPDQEPDAVEDLLDNVEIRYELHDGKQVLTLDGDVVDETVVRQPEVTAQVSQVSRIPAVRRWMVQRQRDCAELGLVVAEGRDIGTVVFPNAKWKFFLTASAEERARRRLAQGGETVDGATLASVTAEIAERDRIDSTRAVAPLKAAPDAVQIDTSDLSIDDVIAKIMTIVEETR